MTPARRRAVAVPVLVAAVGLAIIVAAVGLSDRPSFALPGRHGSDPNQGRDWAFALTSVLAGLLMIRLGRRLPLAYQRLAYRMVGAVLILGPALLLNVNHHTTPAATASTSSAPPTPTRSSSLSVTASPLPPETTPNRRGVIPKLSVGPGIISAILLLAAAALFGLALYRAWMRRPGRHVDLGTRPAHTPPDDVLDSAADAIAFGGAPRDRVIAAYVAMETALDRRGMRRAKQQAPLEWLAELSRLRPTVIEPADALTAIFERARFSAAPVTENDASEAAALLRRLREELGVRT